MSDMRRLLETVTKFAGEPEQKPGDQVRGSDPMPKKGGGKKHPHQGRLVGGESILRELEQQIVEGNVERRLRKEFNQFNEFAPSGSNDGNDGFSDETLKRLAAQWWQGDEDPRIEQTLAAAGWEIGQDEGYDNGGVFVVQAGDVNGNSYMSWPAEELEGLSEEFSDTVKSAADKIVAAGTALGSAIPRPFDEKEVAKDIAQRQAAQSAPKTDWRTAGKKMQEATARIAVSRDPDDPDNYDTIRFHRELPDGSIIDIEPYSGSHNNYYRHITGKEPGQSPTSKAMYDTLVDLMQKPYKPGPVIPEPEKLYPQDTIKEPPKPIDDEDDDIVAEWGAAGTAVGPGNDDADPVELAAQRAQQVAGKTDQQNQLAGLVAQVNGARSQLADLNKQFPQGKDAAEKAYALQGLQSQRVQLGRQIEDLMTQVSAIRSQA